MNPDTADVLDRFYDEDAAQRAAQLPSAQRTRNVDRETGLWLNLLLRTMGARAILEIGSSNAVSTTWLGDAARANGGTVTGAELIPERAAEANRNLADAGLADVARVIPGDAQATIPTLEGPFDVVFIDAEKDDYVAHFQAAIDLVRPGGLILADNVTSHDISAYQNLVRALPDMETVTVPIGRGIEFSVKTARRQDG